MDVCLVATEQLEAELVAHAAWEAAGMARMLAVLFEFDRRRAWASWGCRSAQHWLSWKCGLGYTAASERLRVARCLEVLPVISAAFTGGLLSWSKVRELTRVATADTEARLVDIALFGTAAQVARLVGALRRVSAGDAVGQLAGRGFGWCSEADGSVSITVRLPADLAMPVIAAVQQATVVERGVPRSRSAADAFVELITGRAEVPRPEIVVHVDGAGARFDDGPPVAVEIAECLACDGSVTTLSDTPDGPVVRDRRRAPSPRQRRWLAQRHDTCQFIGCDHTGSFDAHHVVAHAKGGKTGISNLARLCWFHHRIVHLHGLLLTLHGDRRLEVRFPDGTPVDRDIAPAEFLVARPEHPDRIGGSWYGDRLDLDCALAALQSNIAGNTRSFPAGKCDIPPPH
jgi:hypothetical protein